MTKHPDDYEKDTATGYGVLFNKGDVRTLLGCSASHVEQLKREGMPFEGYGPQGEWRVNSAKLWRWWTARVASKARAKTDDAKHRAANVAAELMELKLQKARATYIHINDARAVVDGDRQAIVQEARQISRKVGERVRALDNPDVQTIHAIVNDVVDEALTAISARPARIYSATS